MSARGLQNLIACTVVDGKHKAALLDRRPMAYEGFDLSPEEVAVLMAIQACSLEEFALQAHQLFYNEDLVLETELLPQVVLPVRVRRASA